MRLTVGPLPATVYWRRRATVLVGLLIVALMIVYSCSGDAGKTNDAGNTTPDGLVTSTAERVVEVTPTAGASSGLAPIDQLSPAPEPSLSVDPRLCTDAELLITVVPAHTSMVAGSDLTITLLVKNISKRTCLRDVGADLQELRIQTGSEKIWSSDDCGARRGNDLYLFPPHQVNSYTTIWNGRSSSGCTKDARPKPDGPVPEPGEYQLLGRVGTAFSKPVTLTLS